MSKQPTKTTKELLTPFTIDPTKLGPEAKKFFARGLRVCEIGDGSEASFSELNRTLAELDQEFLALPPKNR